MPMLCAIIERKIMDTWNRSQNISVPRSVAARNPPSFFLLNSGMIDMVMQTTTMSSRPLQSW